MVFHWGILDEEKEKWEMLDFTLRRLVPTLLPFSCFIIIALLVLTFSGCVFSTTDASGYAVPNITVKGMPSDIGEIALIVSGPGMGTIEIYYPSPPASIVIEVPSGDNIQFELLAYITGGSAFPGYRGTATVDLEPGVTQDLVIDMKLTGKIYVANWGDGIVSGTVSVIDGGTNAVINTITVGVGPGGVGVNTATGKVYVANDQDATVSVIDSPADTVSTTINITVSASSFLEPFFVGVNPNTNKIYVSEFWQGYYVHVINGATDSVIATVDTTGSYTNGVGVNPITNKIYVAKWNPAAIIDGSSNNYLGEVSGGSWGDCRDVGVNPNTNKIYVADDTDVHVVDGSTDSEIGTITVGNDSYGVGVNMYTNKIYVANFTDGTVSVIDGSTDSVITTITVGTDPMGVAVNPNNNRIYVANKSSNTVSVIDGSTDTVIATVTVGINPYLLDIMP